MPKWFWVEEEVPCSHCIVLTMILVLESCWTTKLNMIWSIEFKKSKIRWATDQSTTTELIQGTPQYKKGLMSQGRIISKPDSRPHTESE